jgi:pyridoxamine 5'-phosphate oxidase
MTKTEIIQFINANPACHLATADGNQPRVRGMMMYRADEQGILLHTGTPKDLYKQLMANPRVELCFNNMTDGVQVRVSGKAELVEDQKLKEEIVANRPFMKPIIDQHGYKIVAIFRVRNATATVWTMADNLKPKVSIQLC